MAFEYLTPLLEETVSGVSMMEARGQPCRTIA
jgi:hypothetical protein